MRKNAYVRHHAAAGLPTAIATPQPYSPRASWQHASSETCWRRGALLSDVIVVLGALWLLVATAYVMHRMWPGGGGEGGPQYTKEPVLISYSYYEKDPTQVRSGSMVDGVCGVPCVMFMQWSALFIRVVSGMQCECAFCLVHCRCCRCMCVVWIPSMLRVLVRCRGED